MVRRRAMGRGGVSLFLLCSAAATFVGCQALREELTPTEPTQSEVTPAPAPLAIPVVLSAPPAPTPTPTATPAPAPAPNPTPTPAAPPAGLTFGRGFDEVDGHSLSCWPDYIIRPNR